MEVKENDKLYPNLEQTPKPHHRSQSYQMLPADSLRPLITGQPPQ